MKDNRLKYILVLSLLLNFSLLVAAGYTYYQRNWHPPAPFGYRAPERISTGPSPIHPYLFEALSLKPEQRKRFEQKATRFHEALDRRGEKVYRLRRSLFDLMRAGHPDTKTIETTIAEINAVQEDLQKLIVAHMLDFKSMLDKDQQKKFFDLIQEAMAGRQQVQCP
jgi:Spy/CpxP family protein refolding chaperone